MLQIQQRTLDPFVEVMLSNRGPVMHNNIFKSVVRLDGTNHHEIIDFCAHVEEYATGALNELSLRAAEPRVRAYDVSGSEVSGATLLEALTEAMSNHLVVMCAWINLRCFEPTDMASMVDGLLPDLEVDIWAWFHGSGENPFVEITIGGGDRLLVDGLAAKMQREVDRLAVQRRTQAAAAKGREADGPITEQTEETFVADRRESGGEWFKRTWRDHAAGFMLATAAAVVATGVLVWLGIN